MSVETISFLIGLAGFLFLVYPRFSVVPGTSLDLHNPFKTPFIIKNDGFLPLYNIKYSLRGEKIELTTTASKFSENEFGFVNTIDKLGPNKSSALFVDNIFPPYPDLVKTAEVSINVTYRPFWIPFSFTESRRFKTHINSSQEYVWYESYDKQ